MPGWGRAGWADHQTRPSRPRARVSDGRPDGNGWAAKPDDQHGPLVRNRGDTIPPRGRLRNGQAQSFRIRSIEQQAREPARHVRCRASNTETRGRGISRLRATQCWSERRQSAPKCATSFPQKSPMARSSAMWRRGAVMIETVRPIDETTRAEVKFRRVEIAGRRIHAQRVGSPDGRGSLGRADRSRIEHQLRKESRAVLGGSISRFAVSLRYLHPNRALIRIGLVAF